MQRGLICLGRTSAATSSVSLATGMPRQTIEDHPRFFMGNASHNSHGEREYAFRLGNGQKWRLMAVPGMESWLGRMAALMQLEENRSVSGSKIFFVRGGDGKETLPPILEALQRGRVKGLPQNGWRPHLLHLVRIWNHPRLPDLICEIVPPETTKQNFIQMREFLYWIYHHAMERGAVPFHAGLVAKNDTACILTGRSQAGKSTCCKRIPRSWRVLSDDEALVVPSQTNRYVAHPFPTWSDYINRGEERKSWPVETAVPLGAVFFLQQGPTDEVVPLGPGRTAVFTETLSWPEVLPPFIKWAPETVAMLRKKLFENACQLALSVPSFLLRVSLTGHFWEKMEEVLDMPRALPG